MDYYIDYIVLCLINVPNVFLVIALNMVSYTVYKGTNAKNCKCKKCGCNFIMNRKKYNNAIKKDAIFLYLEGMGINTIARFLKVSQQIVSYWIKKYSGIINQFESDNDAQEVVEVDEMCTFLKRKNVRYRYGLCTIVSQRKLLTLKYIQWATKRLRSYLLYNAHHSLYMTDNYLVY